MLTKLSLWLYVALWFSYTTTAPPGNPTSPPSAVPCLNGVINHYTPVTGFGCDSSTLQVGPLSGFAVGDKVLLIQMQVPQVDLSNTPSFGTVLNTTCIGNYEFNRVQSLGGGIVQLQFALTRSYDLSGKIQLVQVPEYDSATVCGLTCLTWNGTIGGVLALDVKNKLTLSGNMDVSAKGFRGGNVEMNDVPWVFGEQQFFYPPQTTLAAEKGEGIVAIPQDHSFGRGRAGNGGGGGNAHNGGGAGGANGGSGGNGGLEIASLPAAPTPNTDGIGGQKHFENQPDKIILGGGAGAGHANDLLGTSGGDGGGIIVLLANTVVPNNFRLLANGQTILGGPNNNDGQGGGGGGGTIVLQASQITSPLTCELKGGNGGSNPYIPDFQVHGPGGGGGGGKLLLTQNMPNVIPAVQGGVNGFSSQSFPNGAMPGESGRVLTGFTIPEGTQNTYPVSSQMMLSLENPGCSGGLNGQISVLQSTALAFSLNGGPFQPDSVFTNLAPGNYQIRLRFSGGCTLDTVAVLTASPPVALQLLSINNASCTGGGSIAVAAATGSAPFEFQLDSGVWQSSGLFSNLFAGAYSITMRDAAGCDATAAYTVSGAPPVQDTLLSLTQATCVSGGSVQISGISGTSPFEYQVNGGAWQTSGLFQNLAAGNYIVQIRDAAGCMHNESYSITSTPLVRDSLLSSLNATCLTGGNLSVGAVSGTSPFQFQLNGGVWQATGLFSNLVAGTYTLTVQDAAGCTNTGTYEIESPATLQDSLVSLTNATCQSGGSLALSAISGTAPFEFQLNGGAWQSGGLFADLVPGNYPITLRDAAGCTSTKNYTIDAPPQLEDTLIQLIPASCIAGGSLSLSAISGTAPFEFQLDNGPWQANGQFTNLPASNYTVTIRDAAGCSQTANYSILPPPMLVDSLISSTHATCVEPGALEILAVSGTAPFEFQINGGTWQPNGKFPDLPAANYTVIVRDAAGCTQTGQYSINAPPVLLDSLLLLTDATCVTGGTISLTVLSGTAPFEFQLGGGAWQTSGLFADLAGGNYTISLRDAAGCIQTGMYSIAAPPGLQDTLIALTNASCLTGGEITVAAISGTSPFEFQLNNDPWQSSGIFSNLKAGNHSVGLRDASGCKLIQDYFIEAPPELSDSLISLVQPTCALGGTISTAAISGTPPFEFQLNGGAWQPGGFFSNLPAAIYAIQVRDAAGCMHSSLYTMTAPPALSEALLSLTDADCHEGGTLNIGAVAGNPPFGFQLDGGPWQNTGNFTDLEPGLHTVQIRDAAACMDSGTYLIEADPPLELQLDSLGVVDCGHTYGYLAVSANGGTGAYDYQITPGLQTELNGFFADLYAGIYDITVTDSMGCATMITGLEISSHIDSVLTRQTVIIYEGAFFQLPDGRKTSKPGEYPFSYQTVEGCDSLHIIDLQVRKRHIYIPNVFLPDDDGPNRFFAVYADESLEIVERLAVFDRWGELIYEKNNLLPNDEEQGWDGNFRNRQVNPGVFVWTAKLKFTDGLELNLSGNVTVVR